MDTHKNARLTPKGREEMVRAMVDCGLSKAAVARRFNTTPKTVAKWADRFRAEGVDGLRDRSSRPLSSPGQTPRATCEAVEALRRQRHTGKQIAAEVGVSPATVSRILKRLGLNRLSALEPAEPVRRYQRENRGELIHIDIKKLGKIGVVGHRITGDRSKRVRGIGWEYVHVCVDDASRIAFVQVKHDERKRSAVAFLKAAVAYYASLGVTVERVMTDNGSC
jgi:transposase